jgi:hypothetical protein
MRLIWNGRTRSLDSGPAFKSLCCNGHHEIVQLLLLLLLLLLLGKASLLFNVNKGLASHGGDSPFLVVCWGGGVEVSKMMMMMMTLKVLLRDPRIEINMSEMREREALCGLLLVTPFRCLSKSWQVRGGDEEVVVFVFVVFKGEH